MIWGPILRTQRLIFVLILVAGFSGIGSARAQDNHSPTCGSKTLVVTEPSTVAANIEVNPISIGPACSDEDGDVLSLTAVTSPAELLLDKHGNTRNLLRLTNNLALNASIDVTFTVSDGNGGTTNATLTVLRKAPNS